MNYGWKIRINQEKDEIDGNIKKVKNPISFVVFQ